MSRQTFAAPTILTTLLLVALPAPSAAQHRGPSCPVPSSAHPVIQAAVDDPACSQITLAAGGYDEAVVITRGLSLNGPATAVATVRGQVVVTGAADLVSLADLELESGCPVPLSVERSAGVEASGLEVSRPPGEPCLPATIVLFSAGFETGDTTEWTTQVP